MTSSGAATTVFFLFLAKGFLKVASFSLKVNLFALSKGELGADSKMMYLKITHVFWGVFVFVLVSLKQ